VFRYNGFAAYPELLALALLSLLAVARKKGGRSGPALTRFAPVS
jgi:hypothetical protein